MSAPAGSTAAIHMPRLSDSMEEGTIVAWLKAVGDEVRIGDELVEIETDKANVIHEADTAGTLLEIVAGVGETRAIGEVIATLGERATDANGNGAAQGAPRLTASPVARRMASELGLDLARINGSGPGGRIVKADVEAASAAQPAVGAPEQPAPPAEPPAATDKGQVEIVELTKLQATVSRRMAESTATAPHFYLQAQVDMSRCVEGRAQIKAAASANATVPSLNDIVIKACAIALRDFPRANGSYRDGRWELYSRVNVGLAVAADAALVVPTIFDADRKGLSQIAAESRTLAARVRDGQITPQEISGGTFTVSNLGMYGVANFHPVINAPQAAILAVGAIDGSALMGVTLACDHRILYGADAAQFLGRVRALLEEPLGLAL